MSHLGFITLCSVAAFFCCCLVSLIESFGSIMGISFDGAGLYYVGNDGCFACLLLLLCTATVIAAVMCLGHRSGFLK